MTSHDATGQQPAASTNPAQQAAAAPAPLTIVVIGGVASGASAATRARRMNEHATIILLEKDAHVSFANCGLPYHIGGEIKDRDQLLVAKPMLFKNRFNIDVRTHTEATAIDPACQTVSTVNHQTGEQGLLHYDRLILAPGASPIRPPMPGIHAANVFSLRNLEDTDRIIAALPHMQTAAIVGAGYIGLELAEQLNHRGIKVALVELQPQILPLMDADMVRPLQKTLTDQGIDLHLGDGIQAIQTAPPEAVTLPGSGIQGVPTALFDRLSTGPDADGNHPQWATGVQLNSGQTLAADAVFLCIGVKANNQLALDADLPVNPQGGGIRVNQHGQTSDPHIYAVGDAAEVTHGPSGRMMRVPLAGPANRAGRLAGEHAATGQARTMAHVQGTAIVRLFDQTAGMTGLSQQATDRFGIPARHVTITAKDHAGYFPGATAIKLKLVYDPDTGRILGAQAVGPKGVDKRIDVIATAMHFGGTVHDLTEVDLAYAPPFGSAKDPVHMAGFTASNQLAGVVDIVPADAHLSHTTVLDVRNPSEVEKLPLPQAPHVLHVPIDQLRAALADPSHAIHQLPKDQPLVVSCASGLRSYVATRLLLQHGFAHTQSLNGGANGRRDALPV